jgi:hypothetical protein
MIMSTPAFASPAPPAGGNPQGWRTSGLAGYGPSRGHRGLLASAARTAAFAQPIPVVDRTRYDHLISFWFLILIDRFVTFEG